MDGSSNPLKGISPAAVLQEIASAIPERTKANLIVIGSLAVGYRYFGRADKMAVRTKDADCLLVPYVEAVAAGRAITDDLMSAGWEMRADADFGRPGAPGTADENLPVVRLHPPGNTDWFMELLTEPASPEDRQKMIHRISTSRGDFALPSFGYLALTSYSPMTTHLGIRIARPQMMALANLLEHPAIGDATMSRGFANRPEIKRANKDLGRVIAIARLETQGDEDALLRWPQEWKEALQARYARDWRELARHAGDGLRRLLASPADLEQAHFTCYMGLLADMPPTYEAFEIDGRRLVADALDKLRLMADAE